MATGVTTLDQVTKSVVLAEVHRPRHVLGPFGLGVSYNSGSAFSLWSGRAPALMAVAVALVVALAVWAVRTAARATAIALALVLGGALGNLGDRLFRDHHGQVVDFITLTHWPTFNVADAAITVGVVLVVLVGVAPSARRSSTTGGPSGPAER